MSNLIYYWAINLLINLAKRGLNLKQEILSKKFHIYWAATLSSKVETSTHALLAQDPTKHALIHIILHAHHIHLLCFFPLYSKESILVLPLFWLHKNSRLLAGNHREILACFFLDLCGVLTVLIWFLIFIVRYSNCVFFFKKGMIVEVFVFYFFPWILWRWLNLEFRRSVFLLGVILRSWICFWYGCLFKFWLCILTQFLASVISWNCF